MLGASDTIAAPAIPAARSVLRPIDVRAVQLDGELLGDWQKVNRDATIEHCIARLESTGVMDNLRRLVGESDAEFRGPLFADSDLYKTLEAIGWEAARGDVSSYRAFADEAFRLLAAVQDGDGYLNSYYQGPHAGERFTDLPQGHEMYCLGHLVQASIAWHHAGDDRLLDIASRYVELVHTAFGEGASDDIDGHPEIETALVELTRITGDARHRELARRMVALRGYRTIGEGAFGGAYYQDLVPVKDAREATGHAVRQMYLLAGVADLELDDSDSGFGATLDAIWDSVHTEKMYVTGGLGSRHRGESFGDPYELPADRAYSETCAAIGNFQWNWRMLLLRGDAKYADEMERGLYNAISVGTAVDGRSFFYSNPLQLRTGHDHEEDAPSERLDWYFVACCPPNLARLMASITGYLATEDDESVQLHLYAAGRYDVGGLRFTVGGGYPWDGAVRIQFDEPSTRPLRVRIPSWADGATLVVDGADRAAHPGTYAEVEAGAVSVDLTLPLSPVFETAHPWIDASRSTVSLRRGPVYYCIESADIPAGTHLEDVVVHDSLSAEDGDWNERLGVREIRLPDVAVRHTSDRLYSPAGEDPVLSPLGGITAVPYFRWANRGPGAMRVWMPIR